MIYIYMKLYFPTETIGLRTSTPIQDFIKVSMKMIAIIFQSYSLLEYSTHFKILISSDQTGFT